MIQNEPKLIVPCKQPEPGVHFRHSEVQNRGSVRAGATGAIAPVNFQIYKIAPVNFEDGLKN